MTTLRRHLQFELLEFRLPLSAAGAGPTVAASAVLVDPLPQLRLGSIEAALSAITTTAPNDVYVSLVDTVGPTSGGPGASLVDAGGLIGLPAFRNDPRFETIDGSGVSIVVIDTGADLDHPFFGPDTDQNGVADRIIFNADFVGQAPTGNDDNGHGTHVSGILASQDATYAGVAPGVNLIVLKVLESSGLGTVAALESALQWVAANVDAYNIVAVNMSLSFGDNNAAAESVVEYGIGDELTAISAQDVIVASSSGNRFAGYGSIPGVAYPSSDPNSLSVGAIWDANVGGPYTWTSGARDETTGPDRITSFSQRHPDLTTIFAPGATMISAGIGGGTSVYSGTSMSTPIVTGVAALVQQLSIQQTGERLSTAAFRQLITDTGVPIFDGDDEDDNVVNTQQWYRRIDIVALADAVYAEGPGNLGLPASVELLDDEAPAGGIARVSFTVDYFGSADSGPFTTGVYLSVDPVLDDGDILLANVTNQLSPGGQIAHARLPAPIPDTVVPGEYFVVVLVDNQFDVEETDESNNVAVHALTVTGDAAKLMMIDGVTGEALLNGSSTLAFGQVLQGAGNVSRTLELYNDGNIALTTSGLVLPNGFVSAGIPASIDARSSAPFEINLDSSGSAGHYSGDVSFSTNDLGQSPFAFHLTGTILPPDDHGNNAGTATSAPTPSVSSGVINLRADRDWFSFPATGGTQYQINVELKSLPAARLRLIDGDGVTEIATSGGVGSPAALAWQAPASGTYYAEVTAAPGVSPGDYLLHMVGDDDDHNDLSQFATPVAVAASKGGTIQTVGDVDWLVVRALAGVEYRVEVALDTLPGAQLRLVGPNGTTQIGVVLVGSEGPAGLNFTAPAVGNYYFEITEAEFIGQPGGPTGGTYDVIVASVSRVPGDYNGDLVVNGVDFLSWQREVGSNGPVATPTLDTAGFETYDAVTNPSLQGQHGWVQLGSPQGSATVQSAVAAGGNNSVRVQRVAGDNWWGVPLEREGLGAPSGDFVFVDWDMRIAATGSQNGGLGPFIGVQAYNDSGVLALLGALGVDATTLDVVYQRFDDGPLIGVLTETGRKISSDAWYRFSILFDFSASQFTVYFEEQPLVTNSFVDLNLPGANTDDLTDADIVALAAQAGAISQSMSATAYFDNFRIFQAISSDPFPADGNYDGLVNAFDLSLWAQSFGADYRPAATQSSTTAVRYSSASGGSGSPALETLEIEATQPALVAGYLVPASTEPSGPSPVRGLSHEVDNVASPRWFNASPQDMAGRRRSEERAAYQQIDRTLQRPSLADEALHRSDERESLIRSRTSIRGLNEADDEQIDARCVAAVDAAFDAW